MHKLTLPLLLIVVLVIYWPGLGGSFVFDDFPSVVENPALRLFDGSWAGLFEASTGGVASPLGRPLSQASFAANFYFGGESPFGFKLVNLLIHLINGLLVFFLAQRLLPTLIRERQVGWAAFWVAAIWLLHPINLTPVLFVVQRMTGLSALFTLAALFLYLQGRECSGLKRWFFLAASLLLCWPAGVLAKETALLLPLYLLIIEVFIYDGLRTLTDRQRFLWGTVGMAIILVVLYWSWPLILGSYQYRDFTLVERLFTEARVLWGYILQIVLPLPDLFALHHDDIPVSRSLINPVTTLLAIVAWLVVVLVAVFQRKSRPWIGFAFAWFLAGHALESSVLGLEIAYEHRNYLPSFGVIVGLVAVLLSGSRRQVGMLSRGVAALSMLAFCALVTLLRANQWGDEYLRTQIEAMTHPQSFRAQESAGRAILSREIASGEIDDISYQMARAHFEAASSLNVKDKGALTGILFLDCAMQAKFDSAAWGELLKRMAEAPLTFGEERYVHGLSHLLSNNRLCLSLEQEKNLIAAGLSNPSVSPKLRGMLYTVAMEHALTRLEDLERALYYAEQAVFVDKGSVVLHVNMIRLLLLSGDIAAAKQAYLQLAQLPIPPANRKDIDNFQRILAQ